MSVGQSIVRLDAYEKVTGRAKYTADLFDQNTLVAKLLHATIANGQVLSIDTQEALNVDGVEAVVTCFDVPDRVFPTAGHPWSLDPSHQDIADRKLLTSRIRLYGDEIAAVVARDELSALSALRKIRVEYAEEPPVLDCEAAMKAAAAGARPIHEEFPDNVLQHTVLDDGDMAEALREEGLIKYQAVYETPAVQHCHLENVLSCAWLESGRIVVMSSTQIPHIVRRIIAQALDLPWGRVRVIKPYIGGGFGNKQDALFEPLNAFLTMKVGGRPVKLELSREEVFAHTRVRHGQKIHLAGYVRPDGRLVARTWTAYSNQGAYASHGHSIAMKGTNVFRQLYRDEKARRAEVFTVYTNTATAGAMRGYGTPQAIFAVEAHVEDMARMLGLDPIEFRLKNLMPVGYQDPFSKNILRYDAFGACLQQGRTAIDWDEKRVRYQNQNGPVRRGVGMALFWYNTAVWPVSVEISSCRMLLNEDGSIQMQLGETEIGQGADTVFAQMASSTLGIALENVHIISMQDTDVTPFGLGSYGSRQTYVGGMAVHKTAMLLKTKILAAAAQRYGIDAAVLDLRDGLIVHRENPAAPLCALGELATELMYTMGQAEQLSAETSAAAQSNAYSFGCTFAEVEVDIPLAKVRLLSMVNVHDAGTLINPRLAEGQVHGGMSMAIGYGLGECLIYNADGRLLNGNLLDYKISTILDHPQLEARFVEHAEPTSPYGTKALGEPPAISGAAAIRNAVLHATGVAINELPLAPQRLFTAFKKAGIL
ncbi:MAG: xanthine dehydrogenase molybdenum-binding subunit XdhA [Spirochaetaceae bacterium]|nr:xanthine dehydrogenase molybdenum-binding subunit XdhA [Spirochaetaceae bacterium]